MATSVFVEIGIGVLMGAFCYIVFRQNKTTFDRMNSSNQAVFTKMDSTNNRMFIKIDSINNRIDEISRSGYKTLALLPKQYMDRKECLRKIDKLWDAIDKQAKETKDLYSKVGKLEGLISKEI